jgi:hypothetical protein
MQSTDYPDRAINSVEGWMIVFVCDRRPENNRKLGTTYFLTSK